MSASNDRDRKFKVVLCGNSGVGKTTIFQRIESGKVSEFSAPTVGSSYLNRTVMYQNRPINMSIWDTAGQDQFRTILPVYFRGSDYVIIVFDITSIDTYNAIENWAKLIKDTAPPYVKFSILGNKSDLDHKRTVDVDQVQQLVSLIGAQNYYEVSAKNGDGIDDFINYLAQCLGEASQTNSNPPTVQIGASTTDATKKSECGC